SDHHHGFGFVKNQEAAAGRTQASVSGGNARRDARRAEGTGQGLSACRAGPGLQAPGGAAYRAGAAGRARDQGREQAETQAEAKGRRQAERRIGPDRHHHSAVPGAIAGTIAIRGPIATPSAIAIPAPVASPAADAAAGGQCLARVDAAVRWGRLAGSACAALIALIAATGHRAALTTRCPWS